MKARIVFIIIFYFTQSLVGMEQEKIVSVDLHEQAEQKISLGYALLALKFTEGTNNSLIFSHYADQSKRYSVLIDEIGTYINFKFQEVKSSLLVIDPRYHDAHCELTCNLIKQDFEQIRKNNLKKEQWLMHFLYKVVNKEEQIGSKEHSMQIAKMANYFSTIIQARNKVPDLSSAYQEVKKLSKSQKINVPPLSQLIDEAEQRRIKQAEEEGCVLY